MSREILDCLKRERDICVKNVIHSQNTAFMFTPALSFGFENLMTSCAHSIVYILTFVEDFRNGGQRAKKPQFMAKHHRRCGTILVPRTLNRLRSPISKRAFSYDTASYQNARYVQSGSMESLKRAFLIKYVA